MTAYAYAWRCPRCGFTYRSPIAVLGVGCPHHRSQVPMRPDDEEESYDDAVS